MTHLALAITLLTLAAWLPTPGEAQPIPSGSCLTFRGHDDYTPAIYRVAADQQRALQAKAWPGGHQTGLRVEVWDEGRWRNPPPGNPPLVISDSSLGFYQRIPCPR